MRPEDTLVMATTELRASDQFGKRQRGLGVKKGKSQEGASFHLNVRSCGKDTLPGLLLNEQSRAELLKAHPEHTGGSSNNRGSL